MFDIGWSEMAIIMLLALIIIGPKDLPRVARTIGQWVRKGRSLAREFQTSLEDMARDTELDDVRKEIEKVGRTDFKKSLENTIDPKGELTKAFEISAEKSEAKPKPKPALTDQTGPSANGHVNGTGAATSSGEEAPGKITPPAAETDPASAATKTAAKKPAAKAESTTRTVEPASRAKKPAAKTAAAKKTAAKTTTAKPAAAKKPVPAAKRSAKPAVSTSASKAKAGAAKRGADPSSADEGGGSTDPAAVVAKSS